MRFPRLPFVAFAVAALTASVAACSSSEPANECAASGGEALSVCAGASTVRGIDVSYYQGVVNWTAVKTSGKDFAFIRVSDGLNTPDTQFANNWPHAKAAGVVRGVYQFFRPGQDPIQQADLAITKINAAGGLQAGDLPLVLDLETVDGQTSTVVVSRALSWLAHVEAKTGRKPLVYTAAFMSSTIGTHFSAYPLWVANYGPKCPTMPSGWTAWVFWQDSSSGTVGGIGGDTDTNYYNGTLAELKTFAAGPVDAGSPTEAGADSAPPEPPPADAGSAMDAGQPPPAPPPPAQAPFDPCAPH